MSPASAPWACVAAGDGGMYVVPTGVASCGAVTPGVERDDAKFWHAPITLAPPPSLSTAPPTRPGRPSTRLPDPPSTATRTFVPHPPSATLASCARRPVEARLPTLADPVAIDRGVPAVETLEISYPTGRADCEGERYRGERRLWRREALAVRYEERMKHREFYENTSRR